MRSEANAILDALVVAEREREEARSLEAMVAMGIHHSTACDADHAQPCVRCQRDQLAAEGDSRTLREVGAAVVARVLEMTRLTDAEMARVEREHGARGGTVCRECLHAWPCPTRRLAAEVVALRAKDTSRRV